MNKLNLLILPLLWMPCVSIANCSGHRMETANKKTDAPLPAPTEYDLDLSILQLYLNSSSDPTVVAFRKRYPDHTFKPDTFVLGIQDLGTHRVFETWIDKARTCLVTAEVDLQSKVVIKADFLYDAGPAAKFSEIARFYDALPKEQRVGSLALTPDLAHATINSSFIDANGNYKLLLNGPSKEGDSFLWSFAFDKQGRIIPDQIAAMTH